MTINLLTKKEKKNIQKFYRARRAKASSWLVIILIGVSVVLLVPVYLLVENINTLTEVRNAQLGQENGDIDAIAVQEEVYLINRKTRVLAENQPTLVYERVSDIAEGKRSGIAIGGISMDGSTIAISGIAQDRETLLAFRRDLEQKEYVASVDLPVSNFAQGVDIRFSIVVTLIEDQL